MEMQILINVTKDATFNHFLLRFPLIGNGCLCFLQHKYDSL